jgi:PaREP1/PaREP8 domain containing family protein
MFEIPSKKLFEKLREEALKKDLSIEELVVEILSKVLNHPLDPSEKVELHLKLADKFLRETEEFLAKGDYVQASEKGWGVAAQMIKAIAAKENLELRSHASLWEYLDKLAEKLQDVELRRLWWTANNLDQNFYESWMTPRDVKYAIEDVKKFAEKLKKLL